MRFSTRFLCTLFLTFCLEAAVAIAEVSNSSRSPEPRAVGDLLLIKKGVNLRKGSSIDMPVIRLSEDNEVVMRESAAVNNGFIRVRLHDGKPAYVFEAYATRITDL